MSRSYVVLAATLAGVTGLAGVAQLTQTGAANVEIAASVESPVAFADGSAAAGLAVHENTLAADVRDGLGLDPIVVIDPACTISVRLAVGDRHDEVACLESQLISAGVLVTSSPDDLFDDATEHAVRGFQQQSGLVVDGVVGPETAEQLGSWVGPDVLPPDDATCTSDGRIAVVDRFNQRAWICEDGEIIDVMPITSAISQPDPGTYEVYAKEMNASSDLTGDHSTMTHFVAFTHGKYRGARIAFHSIPRDRDGEFVQPLDSIGTKELFGDSSGCIRVLPGDAMLIWNWLDVGDSVVVVT